MKMQLIIHFLHDISYQLAHIFGNMHSCKDVQYVLVLRKINFNSWYTEVTLLSYLCLQTFCFEFSVFSCLVQVFHLLFLLLQKQCTALLNFEIKMYCIFNTYLQIN